MGTRLGYLRQILRHRIPGQLVIQLTDRCNALCPQCGMQRMAPFARTTLSVRDTRRILRHAAVKGVRAVSFTGGEPLLMLDQLTEHIRYAGSLGIRHIRTGTNGFLFTAPGAPGFGSRLERIAAALAGTPLRNFWISIDSADPGVHEQMRGLSGVVAGIEKAIPVFHKYGLFPSANLGINRRLGGNAPGFRPEDGLRAENPDPSEVYECYRSAFSRFYGFVIDLGFTMVNTCYPMSIAPGEASLEAVYGASSSDALVRFTRVEKAMIFKALLDTVPEFRSRIRIFSPCCSLHALSRHYQDHPQAAYACRGGKDFFFIDSKGANAYPCGYRGNECLGKYWEMVEGQRPEEGSCYRCDWECFRDPSELFGPILHGLSAPLDLARRVAMDRKHFLLWWEDLRYYRACDFFDGRRAPDWARLRRF